MNGYALLNEAARLIGLDTADEKLKTIGLTLLNSALADIELTPIHSLSARVKVKGVKQVEAVKFCLAALVSNAIGDTAQAENMSRIYTSKKGELKSVIGRVSERLFLGED